MLWPHALRARGLSALVVPWNQPCVRTVIHAFCCTTATDIRKLSATSVTYTCNMMQCFPPHGMVGLSSAAPSFDRTCSPCIRSPLKTLLVLSLGRWWWSEISMSSARHPQVWLLKARRRIGQRLTQRGTRLWIRLWNGCGTVVERLFNGCATVV